MMSEALYSEIETAFKYVDKPDIPQIVTKNLKHPLRIYQKEALQNFIFYIKESKNHKNIPYKHLLFHMATGSGKTNIIASCMLYLYEMGYRNFVFVVNTTNIISKTKENLINRYSSKYLFCEDMKIDINLIEDTFDTAKKESINILFTTTQKLHNDLEVLTKENSITYADFEKEKLVLIADEAHHLNSELKKKKTKDDEQNIKSWGVTTKKLLKTNEENILLEFSATAEINTSQEIATHYKDKLIYEYPLIKFREDGFSKDIKLISDNLTQNQRILQAIMVSIYREIVAKEELNKAIKSVVMFKNPKGIDKINQNFEDFVKMVENLKTSDIEEIFKFSTLDIIKKLQIKFQNIEDLVRQLQYSFNKERCLVIYSTSADKEEKLKLLNSLEDTTNPIKAIFAVNVLNEGWDVLNLFDIVKLDEAKKSSSNTTSEAQLIGRGARYMPFEHKDENNFKRKFDKYPTEPLRVLEEMYFYSINQNEYILSLQKELSKIGLLDKSEDVKEVKLELKESFIDSDVYKNGVVYVNKKIAIDKSHIKSIFDYIGNSYKLQKFKIDNSSNSFNILDDEIKEKRFENFENFKLKDIDKFFVRSAINKKPFFFFASLKRYFQNLNSIDEFITSDDYLADIEVVVYFTKKQSLDDDLKFKFVLEVLDELEKKIIKNSYDYEGSKEFYPVRISHKIPKQKILKLKDSASRIDIGDDFYVFKEHYGTSEEKSFVEFIFTQMGSLKQRYKDVKLIRNEKAFNIHSFDGAKNGAKFEPDFLLLLEDEKCRYQIFCEPKGEHLEKEDIWKEEFLEQITTFTKEHEIKLQDINMDVLKLYENSCYKVYGIPFYNKEKKFEFRNDLYKII